jgi:monovalent cation/hydrogen antiporter
LSHHHDISVLLGLLLAVAALAWLASRLKVAYPVFLVLGGLALSFVQQAYPRFPQIELEPELIFLLFLPPLLYYAGLMTTWRDFKGNLRPITLLAVGLVLLTMVTVALVAHEMIGLSWPASFVLGAIVSPPDAVAATTVLQRFRIPRRIVAVLEGESLVNDATALVAYRIALAAAGMAAFSFSGAVGRFLLVAVGGVAIGLLVGLAVAWIRPRIKEPAVESTFSLLTPYIAYLPAEWLHVSSVLAVVTAGVYLSRRIPQIATPRMRLRGYAVWETLVFILNGLVFILIGLQLPVVVKGLGHMSMRDLLTYTAVVSLVCIAVRLLWVFPATYVPRLLLPSLRRRDPAPGWRPVFLIAWTGMRGVVSLAAAMALGPELGGEERNIILFVTFGVILVTLVGQGLTLAPLIRRLKLTSDRDEEVEEVTARHLSALAALERLNQLATADNADVPPMVDRLRATYDERIAYYSRQLIEAAELSDGARGTDAANANANGDGDGQGEGDGAKLAEAALIEACISNESILREALGAERRMLLKLRDDGVIGDEVMRRVQEELDLEESKLGD